MAATTLGGNQEYDISETGKQLQGTKKNSHQYKTA